MNAGLSQGKITEIIADKRGTHPKSLANLRIWQKGKSGNPNVTSKQEVMAEYKRVQKAVVALLGALAAGGAITIRSAIPCGWPAAA